MPETSDNREAIKDHVKRMLHCLVATQMGIAGQGVAERPPAAASRLEFREGKAEEGAAGIVDDV
ncbi:hypothetical protein [Enterovirga aerilata]|uniref:hypothetical protein n=1 Tax=Enterovirga aerilata TaxID=2730920 RepID=UPI001AEE53E9|nr:hypothetical protein [Enterovirga sp. DB1703]